MMKVKVNLEGNERMDGLMMGVVALSLPFISSSTAFNCTTFFWQ